MTEKKINPCKEDGSCYVKQPKTSNDMKKNLKPVPFKIMYNGKTYGKFLGLTSKDAALDAFKKILEEREKNKESLMGEIEFKVISQNKKTYTFIGERKNLLDPNNKNIFVDTVKKIDLYTEIRKICQQKNVDFEGLVSQIMKKNQTLDLKI